MHGSLPRTPASANATYRASRLEAEWRVVTEAEAAERTWDDVRSVAFEGLAYAQIELIEGMEWPVTGAPLSFEERARDRAHRVRLEKQPVPPTIKPKRLDWKRTRERLAKRLSEPRGAATALDVLDIVKWRHRSRMAQWAPLMLSTPELAAVLRRVASVETDIASVQHSLREGDRDDALRRWGAVIAEALSVCEDLLRAAGVDMSSLSDARQAAPDIYRDQLEQRYRDQLEQRAGEASREVLPRRLEHPAERAAVSDADEPSS